MKKMFYDTMYPIQANGIAVIVITTVFGYGLFSLIRDIIMLF